jgi:hypothetical protein
MKNPKSYSIFFYYAIGGPGAAMQDHEIYAMTWAFAADSEGHDGGPILNVSDWTLSDGESVSPLVWSPKLSSPLGINVMNVRYCVIVHF